MLTAILYTMAPFCIYSTGVEVNQDMIHILLSGFRFKDSKTGIISICQQYAILRLRFRRSHYSAQNGAILLEAILGRISITIHVLWIFSTDNIYPNTVLIPHRRANGKNFGAQSSHRVRNAPRRFYPHDRHAPAATRWKFRNP